MRRSREDQDDPDHELTISLNDSDLVCNVQGVVVRGKTNVCLLVSGGTHKGVDLGHIDVVQFLNSRLDLMLVSLEVADEDERVIILDLLHGRLGGQRVLDHVVSIHLVPRRSRLPRVLGSTGGTESLGPVELDTGSNLLDPGAVDALDDLLLDLPGLLDGSHRSLLSIASLGLLLPSSMLRCRLLGRLGLFSYLRCHSLVEVNQAIKAWSPC